MDDETGKRMMESYEISHGIHIGDKEVVLGVDEKSEMPYLCAFYTSNEIFGSYTDCIVGDDYVEIVELFAERVKAQCEKIQEERAKATVPREVITADMCLPLKSGDSLEGKAAAVRADSIRPEYRSAEHQLVLVTGGNGARGGARGNACFCTNLYTGKRSRWERYDIQGEVKPECLPDWAKERLAEIQKQENMRKPKNREERE